ncbi:MAG: pilin [Xanthomonadales bacterium]|nr:pilin [Xanthomonadales bacterium]
MRSMARMRSGHRYSPGFTIIELMVVITILGILAVIAVVAYQSYTTRTKIVELIVMAGTCRTAVFEAYYFGKRPDGGFGCERPDPTGEYTQSIAVDAHGKIIVTARGFGDPAIDGQVVTLTPMVDGNPAQLPTDAGKSLMWRCGFAGDGTTISTEYLPTTCRG